MAMQLIQPNDRFFVAGARGMAGSAIVRALKKCGYGKPSKGGAMLLPSRQELNLLDDSAVTEWINDKKPDVVVLAAATVGGIEANRNRPADFLLANIRIETQLMEAAWRAGTRRLLFLGIAVSTRSSPANQLKKNIYSPVHWNRPMNGMQLPKLQESKHARRCEFSTTSMQSA